MLHRALRACARAAASAAGRVFALPVFCFLAVDSLTCSSAAPSNPDISAIGDIRAGWSDAADRTTLDFEEVEISIVGALNPYASAAVTLGINEEEGIDVEEAKLVLDRYFPAGLGLTAGKVLVDFGQLNPVHAHAFPFVDRPLMHAEFFGEEGAKDVTARLDWIAPGGGPTVRASAGVIRGDALRGGHDHENDEAEQDPASEESEEPSDLGATGRVELFAEPSPDFSFLVGASAIHGTFEPHENAKATWFGPDLKTRWELGPRSALVVNAEAVFGTFDETEENSAVDPNGWFVSADVRANPRWNFGGFAESTTARDDDDVRTSRYGGFVGLGLMEETTLFRLVGRVVDPDVGDAATEFVLQALFGLGPHRAHRY